MPWVLGFGLGFVLFAAIPLFKVTISSEPSLGGMCSIRPINNTPRAILLYTLQNLMIAVLQFALPLILSTLLYLAIFFKMWKRARLRRLPTASPPTKSTNTNQPPVLVIVHVDTVRRTLALQAARLNEKRRLRSVKVLALTSLLVFCCVLPRPLLL